LTCKTMNTQSSHEKPYIRAVDFDGCLFVNEYPDIGAPNLKRIQRLIQSRKDGDKVILHTCRCGKYLIDAISACAVQGLFFDAINEDISEIKAAWGECSTKPFAHEYWDDRAVRVVASEEIGDEPDV
jgi:hypothetical protein